MVGSAAGTACYQAAGKLVLPHGQGSEVRVVRHPEYFLENDIIAGDFHYIKNLCRISCREKRLLLIQLLLLIE